MRMNDHELESFKKILHSVLCGESDFNIEITKHHLTLDTQICMFKTQLVDSVSDKVDCIDSILKEFREELFKAPVVKHTLEKLELKLEDSLKENKSLLIKIKNLNRYKTYYDLHFKMSHGSQAEEPLEIAMIDRRTDERG